MEVIVAKREVAKSAIGMVKSKNGCGQVQNRRGKGKNGSGRGIEKLRVGKMRLEEKKR